MRRLLSMTLTMLGLVGLVTPDSLASSFVWRSIDRYANQRKIPPEVQDKIVMFTVGHYYIPPGYDPSRISGLVDYYMIHNLGGTLLQLGEHDQYYSYLAKRWDADSDKKELLITLREDARFSDGSRITAQDVVFTFKRLVIHGSTHLGLRKLIRGADRLKEMSEDIPGIAILDDQRIRFQFNTLTEINLLQFTQPDGTILSQKQVNPQTLAVENWAVTSGAYFIAESKRGEQILKANPYFLFAEPGMLQEIRVLKYRDNPEMAQALAAGKMDLTFHGAFASEDDYRRMEQSGVVDIIPRQVNATFNLKLNFKQPCFKEKRARQAVARHLRKNLGDIRPRKDDRYFIRTNQYVLPTHIGVVSAAEYDKMTEGFPENTGLPPVELEQLEFLWFLSREHFHRIVETLGAIGIRLHVYDFYDLPTPKWDELLETSPFFPTAMYINYKEIRDSVEYLDQMGNYCDNRERILAANDRLTATRDKKEKSDLMKEINRLIIDDAVMIPLYHIVHQTIINKNYVLLSPNEFSSTPKLWNIRKKSDGGDPAGR